MASPKGKSRLGAVLHQLDQAWRENELQIKSEEDNHVGQVRQLTTKLHQLLQSQEKCCKSFLSKHKDGISLLFEILKFACRFDHQTTYLVTDSLCLLITSGKGLTILFDAGILRVVMESFVNATKSYSSWVPEFEDMWISFHTLLIKIATKEKRFGSVLRLSGALEASLSIMKSAPINSRVLLPIIQLMKTASSSVANSSIMIKSDVINIILKLIPSCGQRKMQLLKNCLELLHALCKSKTGAKKAVNHTVISLMLSLYQEWHRSDHRNRHISIRKSILNVIKACTLYTFGRKSFLSTEGYRTLYFLGLEGIDNKQLDSVIRLIIMILRKCTKENKLQIKSSTSCFSFSLSMKSNENCLNCKTSEESEFEVCSSDTYTDDVVSESEGDGEDEEDNYEQESCNDNNRVSSENAILSDNIAINGTEPDRGCSEEQINIGNFDYYKKFFPELSLSQVITKERLNPLIRIPTAELMDTMNESTSELDFDDANDSNNSTEECCVQLKMSSIESTNSCCVESHHDQLSNHILANNKLSNHQYSSTVVDSMAANKVKSVSPFVKETAVSMHGHLPPVEPEELLSKTTNLSRVMMFQDFARIVFPDKVVNRTVFDLDILTRNNSSSNVENVLLKTASSPIKKSRSATKLSPGKRNSTAGLSSLSKEEILKASPLSFESRFESGNLRKAIQIRQYEYDLILNADVNTNHHHQWFFFQVENMTNDVDYRFNIINCEKANSQLNFGMQPVIYSERDAKDGNPGWERIGSNVCYYRNFFVRGGQNFKYYFTATFTIRFSYANDTCYLAYHYPYTATMLNLHLHRLENTLLPMVFFRKEILCQTLSQNDVYLLTITSLPFSKFEDVARRPYVLLTARVHPGESNSSWIMKGVLDFLLSNDDSARQLRSMFIFKIVPMLNPDGVINGCHRCSLSGEDLNRQWKHPDERRHPTIYHTKSILQVMKAFNKTPVVFVDFHGHSRKKNVFMYGCSSPQIASSDSQTSLHGETEARLSSSTSFESSSMEKLNKELFWNDDPVQLLPRIMSSICPCFALQNCNFTVEKSKEATARVVGYREFGITNCYTMESTYCGMDQGPYKGNQIGTRELEETGRFFCLSLSRLSLSTNIQLSDEANLCLL